MPIIMLGCAVVLSLLVLAAIVASPLVPSIAEKSFKVSSSPPPYQSRDEVNALHSRLFIANLHADSLLWNRDLLKRRNYGHVDLPRLIEGNVALQVFGVVTKSPKLENQIVPSSCLPSYEIGVF